MQDIELPNKKYFKIGETSSLLGIKPHVLRYWESEFPQIRPFKSPTGQRLYKRTDLESLVRIQKLLYQERFTIAGAKQALNMPEPNVLQENLLSVKTKLENILQLLK